MGDSTPSPVSGEASKARGGSYPLRDVMVLSALFCLSGLAGTVVVASASVIGLDLAPEDGLATLPVALALLGGMLTTVPASRAMERWGRRPAFLGGTFVALSGAVLAGFAIHAGSFSLFCLGSLMLGSLGGLSGFYRFAAVDLAPGHKSRAIAAVLASGIVAGLVGPVAGAAARDFAPTPFVGSYILLALVALLVLLLLPLGRFLPPPPRHETAVKSWPLVRQPAFRRAALASGTAFASMVLTMVAAPVSMRHEGHSFAAAAFVIQAHVVAMYVPSFFSGRLVERIGTLRTAWIGMAGLVACVAINLTGVTVPHHWTSLVLLGLGWNLLYVAGSSTLAAGFPTVGKARVQGLHDFLVATVGAAAAFSAGPVLAAIGWKGLNLAMAVLVIAAGAGLAVMEPRKGEPMGEVGESGRDGGLSDGTQTQST